MPAPGLGALSIAREVPSKHPLPILDIDYRARQIAFRRKQISDWLNNEHDQLRDEMSAQKAKKGSIDEDYFANRVADMQREAQGQEKEALATYGMLEGSDPRVAPLRRALAVWGLTADDIGVLSIHGTSTGANVRDKYLPTAYNTEISILNRRRTKPESGTTCLLQSLERLAMLSRSWRRRACAVTPREVPLPGRWQVCSNQSTLE